jgi:hypothetical protein
MRLRRRKMATPCGASFRYVDDNHPDRHSRCRSGPPSE